MYNQGGDYCNYSDGYQNDGYINTENAIDEEALRRLHLDIFFLCLIIIANILGIALIIKRIKIIRGQGNQATAQSIMKDAEIAVLLVLIATSYFAYRGWLEYKNNPTDENLAFLISLILIIIALIIRYIALLKSTSPAGVEDIVT